MFLGSSSSSSSFCSSRDSSDSSNPSSHSSSYSKSSSRSSSKSSISTCSKGVFRKLGNALRRTFSVSSQNDTDSSNDDMDEGRKNENGSICLLEGIQHDAGSGVAETPKIIITPPKTKYMRNASPSSIALRVKTNNRVAGRSGGPTNRLFPLTKMKPKAKSKLQAKERELKALPPLVPRILWPSQYLPPQKSIQSNPPSGGTCKCSYTRYPDSGMPEDYKEWHMEPS
eukprot:Filipodium_phascolosomae@DN7177_c0_g1_i1.p1